MHFSRYPESACAVIATIGILSLFGRFSGADERSRLKSVHDGHLNIHQDQIVGDGVKKRQRFLAVPRDVGHVPHPGEERDGDLLIHRSILHEKYFPP